MARSSSQTTASAAVTASAIAHTASFRWPPRPQRSRVCCIGSCSEWAMDREKTNRPRLLQSGPAASTRSNVTCARISTADQPASGRVRPAPRFGSHPSSLLAQSDRAAYDRHGSRCSIEPPAKPARVVPGLRAVPLSQDCLRRSLSLPPPLPGRFALWLALWRQLGRLYARHRGGPVDPVVDVVRLPQAFVPQRPGESGGVALGSRLSRPQPARHRHSPYRLSFRLEYSHACIRADVLGDCERCVWGLLVRPLSTVHDRESPRHDNAANAQPDRHPQ